MKLRLNLISFIKTAHNMKRCHMHLSDVSNSHL